MSDAIRMRSYARLWRSLLATHQEEERVQHDVLGFSRNLFFYGNGLQIKGPAVLASALPEAVKEFIGTEAVDLPADALLGLLLHGLEVLRQVAADLRGRGRRLGRNVLIIRWGPICPPILREEP